MPKRPYVSFAEVKEKVPIPEVLDILGISDQFQRQGDVLTGVCPLPTHHHGPSPNQEQFKINRRDGLWLWHCFGDCQKGGDVIEFVKEMTGYDDAHVRFWFVEKVGDRLTRQKPKGPQKVENDTAHEAPRRESPQAASATPSNLPEGSRPLKKLRFRLDLDPDVPYLRDRGLTEQTIRRYGLGLCQRGLLKGYVAIPVFACPRGEDTNPLAYLGRWPGDVPKGSETHPRYKWPDGFSKSRIVYGLAEALADTQHEPLIVVEGPFKVYHLVQAGFPGAVAIFGCSLSDEQAGVLASTDRPIVLMFDGNEAGQNGMRTAAGKLITKAFVRVVKLPDRTEPDDLSAEDLRQILP